MVLSSGKIQHISSWEIHVLRMIYPDIHVPGYTLVLHDRDILLFLVQILYHPDRIPFLYYIKENEDIMFYYKKVDL